MFIVDIQNTSFENLLTDNNWMNVSFNNNSIIINTEELENAHEDSTQETTICMY